MKFIVQSDEPMSIDTKIILDILDNRSTIHSYELCKLENVKKYKNENIIPIGTIEFVETWLKEAHNILFINPIEIPSILRTEEFLKREYNFINYKDIPKKGNYFLKDISKLKQFSFSGNINHIVPGLLNKEHIYQLSENVNILSEYRVYIISGKISSIANYDGDPTIFPDINLINKANLIYSQEKEYPISYTMDIMITEKGTSIIEIHPFTSVGLYNSLWGTELLNAYIDGIEYIKKYNSSNLKKIN